ncbi:MAG: hypothetical protein AAF228_04730 [Pseudomonadota bacterium]
MKRHLIHPEYSQEEDMHWHLDRKVPVALIATLIIQTLGFAFYMGNLSHRVQAIEKGMQERSKLPDRTTRLESELRSVRDILSRIEVKLDKVSDRQYRR